MDEEGGRLGPKGDRWMKDGQMGWSDGQMDGQTNGQMDWSG